MQQSDTGLPNAAAAKDIAHLCAQRQELVTAAQILQLSFPEAGQTLGWVTRVLLSTDELAVQVLEFRNCEHCQICLDMRSELRNQIILSFGDLWRIGFVPFIGRRAARWPTHVAPVCIHDIPKKHLRNYWGTLTFNLESFEHKVT